MSEQNIFREKEREIKEIGFTIVDKDLNRPWGGFFVIDEKESLAFIDQYFGNTTDKVLDDTGKMSPKILVVKPHKRLSWQYHHRRAEVWKVLEGPVGVVISDTDKQPPANTYNSGDLIILNQGMRHRLVGLEKWGVIAEIWQHTNPDETSNEDDIVRLEDDFGR